jgi:hypothetical protein
MDPKFNLKSDGLHSFIEKFKNRALNHGWCDICTIPVPPTVAAPEAAIPVYNLLEQFGMMRLANIKADALTYQFAEGRAAQNLQQIYQFAYTSVDDLAQANVATHEQNSSNHPIHSCNP